MFVMSAVADHVPGIVQERPGLQQHARMRRQMMHRLQLIEQQNTQFAHVFRVLLFVSKSPGEASRPHQQLSLRHVVSVRFLARKRFARLREMIEVAAGKCGEQTISDHPLITGILRVAIIAITISTGA